MDTGAPSRKSLFQVCWLKPSATIGTEFVYPYLGEGLVPLQLSHGKLYVLDGRGNLLALGLRYEGVFLIAENVHPLLVAPGALLVLRPDGWCEYFDLRTESSLRFTWTLYKDSLNAPWPLAPGGAQAAYLLRDSKGRPAAEAPPEYLIYVARFDPKAPTGFHDKTVGGPWVWTRLDPAAANGPRIPPLAWLDGNRIVFVRNGAVSEERTVSDDDRARPRYMVTVSLADLGQATELWPAGAESVDIAQFPGVGPVIINNPGTNRAASFRLHPETLERDDTPITFGDVQIRAVSAVVPGPLPAFIVEDLKFKNRIITSTATLYPSPDGRRWLWVDASNVSQDGNNQEVFTYDGTGEVAPAFRQQGTGALIWARSADLAPRLQTHDTPTEGFAPMNFTPWPPGAP